MSEVSEIRALPSGDVAGGYNFSTMLKKIVMAPVAVLLAAIALSAQPNKNATQKETTAPEKNLPVISTPNHQNSGKTNATKPSPDPPASPTPLKDPNWALVIVGTITCFFIGWQTVLTKKAAEAD